LIKKKKKKKRKWRKRRKWRSANGANGANGANRANGAKWRKIAQMAQMAQTAQNGAKSRSFEERRTKGKIEETMALLPLISLLATIYYGLECYYDGFSALGHVHS
jgi:hypothetical protein